MEELVETRFLELMEGDGGVDEADRLIPLVRAADPKAMQGLLAQTIRNINKAAISHQEFALVKLALIPFDRFDWSHFGEKGFPIATITLLPGVLGQLSSVECFVLWSEMTADLVTDINEPNVWKVIEGADYKGRD